MQPSETRCHCLRSKLNKAAASVAALGFAAGLTQALAAIPFTPDVQPTGWVSRPAITSTDLRSGSEIVFRPDYKAGVWSGSVRANHINASGDVLGSSPWALTDTAAVMASKMAAAPVNTYWDTGRRIVTRHSNGSNVPFRWASLDPGTQQAALGTATTGPVLLNYVRGQRANEDPSGTKLRKRDSIQGDIQHSTLLYWKHASGERRLYVGGNDGMLHVFDATDGSEVFAYLPSMLIPRLSKLAVNPYSHTLFVDGGLALAEVTLTSGVRTLLAGALGGGGRGLFMLDVTSPAPATELAAASAIKWEISSATTGFANLGHAYAAPRLARLNNGTAAVIVGNGYNNTGNGRASLYVINADTGASICEADTGSGSTTSPNGLSTAALVDANADGKVDYAYAGDIDGNLWRFDLRGATTPACTATKLLTTSPAQAITTAPVVINHPMGGRLVLMATGRVLTDADASNTAGHYAYGLWDGAPVANTTWLDQTVAEVVSGTQRLRTATNNVPNWASGGHMGWRLSLPAGERVIGESPFVNDDRYYFTSTNPTVASAGDGQAEGANWLNEVNAFTGGSPSAPIFDVNGDGVINATDNMGGAVVVGKFLGAGVISQVVLTDLSVFSQALYNRQSDIDYSPPTSSADPGVSGGHFDPDFYFMTGTTFAQIKHRHEYDDTFDVTGVNFLNASDPAYNLGSKLANGVAFKVLVMNQYLNPAAKLTVGGAAYASVKDYGGQATTTDPAVLLAAQASHNIANVSSLAFNLPLDAFVSKDWWGDGGVVRAGLMPTTTGCVNRVTSAGATPTLGPNGERHDGALTLQLIKAATPSSALELNYPAGGSKYGWRVKAADFTTYVLAEYTVFWHHPNGKCYGQVGWVPNPPQDVGGSTKTSAAAAGSSDPRFGNFGVAPPGVTITSTVTTVNGDTTTTVITFSDSKTQKSVVTLNGDGTESVTTTGRDGTVSSGTRISAGSIGTAPEEVLQPSRRINWREVVRQ